MFTKTIGILGGMGAAATAKLYEELIKSAQENYGAVEDIDFPRVALLSLPVNYLSHKGYKNNKNDKYLLIINEALNELKAAKADFIITACNTLHIDHDELQSGVGLSLLNIVDETSKKVLLLNYKHVGVVASAGSRSFGLYRDTLNHYGINAIEVTNDEQKAIDEIIHKCMSGKYGEVETDQLIAIFHRLINSGAEAIVLGCTELSMLREKLLLSGIPIVDSMQTIVETALNKAWEES